MTDPAPITHTEYGLEPAGPGWYVLNLRDAAYTACEGFGRYAPREADDARFEEFGVGIHVLMPGEPNGLYHAEGNQEAFFVVSGECLLIVEGEERRLRQWDFFHCPAGTQHVFVGAGDGPCAILMAGVRTEDEKLLYPVSELAERYGASAEEETPDPQTAYARFERPERGRPTYWNRLPWS